VDQLGFDAWTARILLTILEKYDGGPVGLGTLAAALLKKRTPWEDVYELLPDPVRLSSSAPPEAGMGHQSGGGIFRQVSPQGVHPALF